MSVDVRSPSKGWSQRNKILGQRDVQSVREEPVYQITVFGRMQEKASRTQNKSENVLEKEDRKKDIRVQKTISLH